jgi:hypothetical protein
MRFERWTDYFAVLDQDEVVHAIERMKRRRTLRLVQGGPPA